MSQVVDEVVQLRSQLAFLAASHPSPAQEAPVAPEAASPAQLAALAAPGVQQSPEGGLGNNFHSNHIDHTNLITH